MRLCIRQGHADLTNGEVHIELSMSSLRNEMSRKVTCRANASSLGSF